MKKILLTAAISAFVFAGCSENKTNDAAGHEHGPETHEHKEGSDHSHADTAKLQQEVFTVDTTKKEESHEHPHSHEGEKHNH